MLRKGKSSLQYELDEYFLHQNIEYSKSAFSQQRVKLKHEVFTEMNKLILEHFYQKSNIVKRWKGHRLVGIDGSTMQLPTSDELIRDFGIFGTRTENNRKVVLARISQAYDVLNNLTIDAKIKHYRTSELSLAESHLSALAKNDLLIMDRAYGGFWFMSMLQSKEMDFVIRLKAKRWTVAKEFLNVDKEDHLVCISPSNEAKKKCVKKEISDKPMTLRLIKVKREGEEDYVLITNLTNQDKYSTQELASLYGKRWPVEESFKHLKLRAELENLSGKSTLAVKQDFHRIICRANLGQITAEVMAGEKVKSINQKRKKKYQINRCQTYRKIASIIEILITEPIRKWIEKLKLFGKQIANQVEIVRPNRKNPINRRYGGRPVNFMAYKP